MKKTLLFLFVSIFSLTLPLGLLGQEGELEFDPFEDPFAVPAEEDEGLGDDPFADMFGDGMIEEVESDPSGSAGQAAYEELLTAEGILIGGRMYSTLTANWGWRDGSTEDTFYELLAKFDDSLSFSLGTDIFFDARPTSELRVFFKFRTEYPFDDELRFIVRELYTDVTLDTSILFRFGKQTVNWGVGRFFSPADVIALVPIDPENPDAEREGPLALRMSAPIGLDHTFDAYVVGNESVRRLRDLGFAARMEFVFQPLELGLGVAYQQDRPFRAVLTARLPYQDFDFFGEGRLSFGRLGDRIEGLALYSEDTNTYFSGTLGFSYMNQDNNISLVLQYMYNGEGYDDSSLLGPAFSAVVTGAVPASALTYFGKHYLGASIGSSEFLHEDLSASVSAFANMSDLSGIANASLTWQAFEGFSLGPVIRFAWGRAPSEYYGFDASIIGFDDLGGTFGGFVSPRNSFGRFGLGLQFTIGGGRF